MHFTLLSKRSIERPYDCQKEDFTNFGVGTTIWLLTNWQ